MEEEDAGDMRWAFESWALRGQTELLAITGRGKDGKKEWKTGQWKTTGAAQSWRQALALGK